MNILVINPLTGLGYYKLNQSCIPAKGDSVGGFGYTPVPKVTEICWYPDQGIIEQVKGLCDVTMKSINEHFIEVIIFVGE